MLSDKHIIVEHDGMVLPCKREYHVKKMRNLVRHIQDIMDTKRPRGMFLRYTTDSKKKLLRLEARNTLPVDVMERALKDGGWI